MSNPANTHRPGSETDDHTTDTSTLPKRPASRDAHDGSNALPILHHRLRHTSSILAIAVGARSIFAGTEGGEIVVYCLETFEQTAIIQGHRGSVLSLCLSQDQELLFSGAGDRIVNVWHTRDLARAYCLYSTFDIGDVFCIAYSAPSQTIYLGAQNTTVQWCSLKDQPQSTVAHPSLRDDPFFDSAGPGGIRTPRPTVEDVTPKHARGGEVIEISRASVEHYAHHGFVYCMMLIKNSFDDAPVSEFLVTGGGDGAINFWTLNKEENGAIDKYFHLDDGREEGHAILSIAIEGTFIYAGRSGGEIDVWDLETRQLVRNVKAHRDDVLTICAGGGFLFSAAINGYVRKFDRQYQLGSRLKAHEGRILTSAFGFYKQKPFYFTGSSDQTLAVWDVRDCAAANVNSAKTSNEMLVESLRRFVSYRTVSSDSKHQVDCRRGASYLRSVFKNFGATTEMLPTPNSHNPIILAKFRGHPSTAATRKKILFYGHYDVVAADNSRDKWLVDPFDMQGIDGCLYGRGTSDNKGPIMAAIFACAELTNEKSLASDIIFLIEGEEECGSRGFEEAVRAHKEMIGDVDWILLANSYWLDDRIPCLTYGLRGVIHATVQIESAHPDLHSGVDGSAQLDESLKDLVMLLGTLMGKNGQVKIPGFYDPIPDLTREEEELYKDISNALLQRSPELADPKSLATSLMRRWRDPTLTVHRFQTSGPDNATIIPKSAKATISMRLVPNQEASVVAKDMIRYLHAEFDHLDSKNVLTVTIDHQAEPWLGDWRNDLFKTLEEAIMDAWGPIDQTRRRRSFPPKFILPTNGDTSAAHDGYFGVKSQQTTSAVLASESTANQSHVMTPVTEVTSNGTASAQASTSVHTRAASAQVSTTTADTPSRRRPLYIREGGSIPAVRFLEKEFDAPAAHFPCGQASDSAHLDNERLRLINLYKSRDIFKTVFRDLPAK